MSLVRVGRASVSGRCRCTGESPASASARGGNVPPNDAGRPYAALTPARCAMERVPDEDELRAFLHRMIVEARRMDDPARVDDLLDKLGDMDELRAFLTCVLQV